MAPKARFADELLEILANCGKAGSTEAAFQFQLRQRLRSAARLLSGFGPLSQDWRWMMEQVNLFRQPGDLGLIAFIDQEGGWIKMPPYKDPIISACDPKIALLRGLNTVPDRKFLMFRRAIGCTSVTHELVDADKLSIFELEIENLEAGNLVVRRTGERFIDVFFRRIDGLTDTGRLGAVAGFDCEQSSEVLALAASSPTTGLSAEHPETLSSEHPETLWSNAEQWVLIENAKSNARPRDLNGYLELLVEAARVRRGGELPDAFEGACWLYERRPLIWSAYFAPAILGSDSFREVMSRAQAVVSAFPPLPDGGGAELKYSWPDAYQRVSLDVEENGIPDSIAELARKMVAVAKYSKNKDGNWVPAENGPSAQKVAENWLKKYKPFVCQEISKNRLFSKT